VPSLREELDRLRRPDEPVVRVDWAAGVEPPAAGDALARAVLLEAVRNSRKHAVPHELDVAVRREEHLFELEIVNDGARAPRTTGGPGLGLRLVAFQALALGGIVEAGPLEGGRWRVRLALPV
jgi:signal transduction histidine kinase